MGREKIEKKELHTIRIRRIVFRKTGRWKHQYKAQSQRRKMLHTRESPDDIIVPFDLTRHPASTKWQNLLLNAYKKSKIRHSSITVWSATAIHFQTVMVQYYDFASSLHFLWHSWGQISTKLKAMPFILTMQTNYLVWRHQYGYQNACSFEPALLHTSRQDSTVTRRININFLGTNF